MTKPLYIFDLDGTLALMDHRRHHVELKPGSRVAALASWGIYRGPHEKFKDNVWVEFDGTGTWALDKSDVRFTPDWPAFYRACTQDLPNLPVCTTFQLLQSTGADVWIWSARSDEVESETRDWLRSHELHPRELRMRPAGDYTADDTLKRAWYESLRGTDRARLVGIFDDRAKVVNMWRSIGVPCFQVAPGEF